MLQCKVFVRKTYITPTKWQIKRNPHGWYTREETEEERTVDEVFNEWMMDHPNVKILHYENYPISGGDYNVICIFYEEPDTEEINSDKKE